MLPDEMLFGELFRKTKYHIINNMVGYFFLGGDLGGLTV
jgi:hypothetical protein